MLNKDAIVRAEFHRAWGEAKDQPDYDKSSWEHVQKYLDYPAATRIERQNDALFPPANKLGIVLDFKLIDSEGRVVNAEGRPTASAEMGAMYTSLLMKVVFPADKDTRPAVDLFNNVFAINKELANTLQGHPARS